MNDENKRDQELDGMLDALRADAPTTAELYRWNAAVTRAAQRGKVPLWTGIAAALLGAVVGAAATRGLQGPEAPCVMTAHQEMRPVDAADATFELTSVKLD